MELDTKLDINTWIYMYMYVYVYYIISMFIKLGLHKFIDLDMDVVEVYSLRLFLNSFSNFRVPFS